MKSCLTTNIDFETRNVKDVLTLPQYAILQNDVGAFVQIEEGKIVRDIPVVLGLQDLNGIVEVKSGVTEGQRVLNVGFK